MTLPDNFRESRFLSVLPLFLFLGIAFSLGVCYYLIRTFVRLEKEGDIYEKEQKRNAEKI